MADMRPRYVGYKEEDTGYPKGGLATGDPFYSPLLAPANLSSPPSTVP